MLILSLRKVMLYSYDSIKREKYAPTFISGLDLKEEVKYMQFPTFDTIALFYEGYF